MIKRSGADYAYIMGKSVQMLKKKKNLFCIFLKIFTETFGPFMAFIRLWIECMIVRPCSQAIVSLTFSVYVLKPFFPGKCNNCK